MEGKGVERRGRGEAHNRTGREVWLKKREDRYNIQQKKRS